MHTIIMSYAFLLSAKSNFYCIIKLDLLMRLRMEGRWLCVSRGNPEYNRHHILFPERIWKDILGDAKEFRSVFVVKMRTTQHTKLHRRLDGLLGEKVSEKDFPRSSTLNTMVMDYNFKKERIGLLNIHQKIDWLLAELDPNDKRNKLLISLLRKQRTYLKYYKIT